ncbi:MAG TPA: DUF58 domain-containing protein [Saprospiraceae bacterium]|nr:DUF58 domain-containing protein [Saprospiraceae bacterium]
MDAQELLKKVRKIEIKTKGISRHLFTGAYHSVFKGRGMTFSEVREYTPGDDVRHIDWNVTARTGLPFVKVYEEERELTLMLIVDISSSTLFGSNEQLKSEWIAEIAAVLAFSATQNNDKVGLILFDSQVRLYIPPKKGRQHILRIIREILGAEYRQVETALQPALEYFSGTMNKRSICFILSDFYTHIPETTLRLVSKKHELTCIVPFDPIEKNLKGSGVLALRNPETNDEFLVDLSNKNQLEVWHKNEKSRLTSLQTIFSKANVSYLSLTTGEEYIKNLLSYFKSKGKR